MAVFSFRAGDGDGSYHASTCAAKPSDEDVVERFKYLFLEFTVVVRRAALREFLRQSFTVRSGVRVGLHASENDILALGQETCAM